jgi:hypothetical protein
VKLASLILMIASMAQARDQPRNAARITVLAPKPGMQKEFEEGYKRHLEWHRANGDRWTWYGWTVITGERFGQFIDGTFDHAPGDFDAPVAPAEDAADNGRNVLPYANVSTTSFYRLRTDLSRGSPNDLRAPLSLLITVRVHAGRGRDFAAALRRMTSGVLCFELIAGGPQPSYLLFVPAQKMSETLRDVLPESDAIESAVSETLRYRAELTYLPPVGTPRRP